MNKRDVIKYCLTLPNTFEDYPFQDDTVSVVMKHTNNKKLQKQLNKLIGEPTKEMKIRRSISGSIWEISFDEKSKIQRVLVKANIYEL